MYAVTFKLMINSCFIGQEKLIKVKKIQEASKQGKERHLLDQHKAVWQKEFLRENAVRKKLQVSNMIFPYKILVFSLVKNKNLELLKG